MHPVHQLSVFLFDIRKICSRVIPRILYAIAFVINRVYHKREKGCGKNLDILKTTFCPKSSWKIRRNTHENHNRKTWRPNYELDTLTKTGWREAELAAEYLAKLQIKAFYVSPLGRAQDTAGCTLKKMNRTAETLDWLREFEAHIDRPDVKNEKSICWDWLPQDMEKDLDLYDRERWNKTDIMRKGNVEEAYRWVCDGLDALTEKAWL